MFCIEYNILDVKELVWLLWKETIEEYLCENSLRLHSCLRFQNACDCISICMISFGPYKMEILVPTLDPKMSFRIQDRVKM